MNIKDRYLRFTYNGINSEEFGIFYENYGEDITFPFSESVSHKTTKPLFQGREYWMGADINSKTIQLDLAADKRQMEDMESIFRWLDSTKPGKLRFDFRDNYEFEVIITSIGNAKLIPHEHSNGLVEMITRFSVTFKTIGDHLLTTHQPYFIDKNTSDLIREPDQLLPIITPSSEGFQFNNWSTSKQNMKFNIKGNTPKIIIDSYSPVDPAYGFISNSSYIASVDTAIGAMESDGTLFEIAHPTIEVINVGPNPIPSGLIYGGRAKIKSEGNLIKIKHNNRMEEALPGAYRLAIIPKIDKNTKTKYFSREDGDLYTGLYPVTASGDIIVPRIAIGTITNGEFIFSLSGVVEDYYDIKISKTVLVKVADASEYSILMSYKKEV